MRLESVLGATGAKLLNRPDIGRFENLTARLSGVTRGSLFFCTDASDIPEAIGRGAYGIIGSCIESVMDDEIAWIRIESPHEALPKLLRLWLVEEPRDFYLVGSDTLEYIDQIHYDTATKRLRGDYARMAAQILESRPGDRIFGSDATFLNRIGVDFRIPGKEKGTVDYLEGTLFESTVLVGTRRYERLPVPRCTFDAFAQAVEILTSMSIPYGFNRIAPIGSFDPIFFDSRWHEAAFGTTERVLILMDSPSGCGCLETLARVSWLPVRIFLPTGIKLECDIKKPIEPFDNPTGLVRRLSGDFDRGYAAIVGMQRDELIHAVATIAGKTHTTKGLF